MLARSLLVISVVAALGSAARADGLDGLGLDLGGLTADQKAMLQKLVDEYPSPCGKAHSLATSLRTDPSCKRAPFAGRYLLMLVRIGLTQREVEEHYEERFVTPDHCACKPGGPVRGDEKAKVEICEFSDFQCPHCKAAEPILRRILDEDKGKVKLLFKNYPLNTIHPDARMAAAAALAAAPQGKFWQMHDLLFERQDHLGESDLEGYARALKLDVKKWKADLPAALARVDADHAEGEALHVSKTPTICIDGKEYKGPLRYEIVKDWVDEAIAAH